MERSGLGHGTKLGTHTISGMKECRARQGRATTNTHQLHPVHHHSCDGRLMENRQRSPRHCLAQLQPFGLMCPCRVRASIHPPSHGRALSQLCCGHEASILGKGWALTQGRLSVLTSTSQKCSAGQEQLRKRQGEKQQEAKAWTAGRQGKGWKAATHIVKRQEL